MSTYHATALNLHHHPLGEADRILVLFTREFGIKRVVAKGARRAKSKLGGRSEPLHCGTWQLAKGKNMDLALQCETLRAHRGLRTDLDRLLHGLYLGELCAACLEDGQPAPEVFDTLQVALLVLEQARCPSLVAAWFELALLDALGYDPELEACIHCEAPVEGNCGFSSEGGGVLCGACHAVSGGMRLHEKGLSLLRRLRAVEAPELLEHDLNPSLLLHARAALQDALEAHAARPIRSLELLANS